MVIPLTSYDLDPLFVSEPLSFIPRFPLRFSILFSLKSSVFPALIHPSLWEERFFFALPTWMGGCKGKALNINRLSEV